MFTKFKSITIYITETQHMSTIPMSKQRNKEQTWDIDHGYRINFIFNLIFDVKRALALTI